MDMTLLKPWALKHLFGCKGLLQLAGAIFARMASKGSETILHVTDSHIVNSYRVLSDYKKFCSWKDVAIYSGTHIAECGTEYFAIVSDMALLPVLPIPVCIGQSVVLIGKDCTLFKPYHLRHLSKTSAVADVVFSHERSKPTSFCNCTMSVVNFM